MTSESEAERSAWSLDWVAGKLEHAWSEEESTTRLDGESFETQELRKQSQEQELELDFGALDGDVSLRMGTEHEAYGQGQEGRSRSEEVEVGAHVGGGLTLSAGMSGTESVLDEEGEVVSSHGGGHELMGGLVASEDGHGVQGGHTLTQVAGEHTSIEHERSAQLTDRGAAVHRKVGIQRDPEDKGLVAGVWTSADGKVQVFVEPDASGALVLTCTLSLGMGAGGELGAKTRQSKDPTRSAADNAARGQFGGKGSAAASAGGSLTYTRVLSTEQAREWTSHLDDARRGQANPEDLPEFGLIRSISTAGQAAEDGAAGRATALLGDAGAAASLRQGEALELGVEVGLEGSAELGGSMDGYGASFGAGGSLAKARTVRVERATQPETGEEVVRLTVAWLDEAAWNAKLAGEVQGLKVAHARTGGSSDGMSVTLELDPEAEDYAEVYEGAVGCLAPEALREYAAQPEVAGHAMGWTRTEGRTAGQETSVAGVSMSESSAYASSVSVGGEGIEAAIEGSRETGVGIGMQGLRLQNSSESGVSMGIHGESTTLDLSHAESSTGGATSESLWQSFKEMLGWKAIEKTPAETLEEVLLDTKVSLREYKLGTADTLTLVDRAHDRTNWSYCAVYAGTPEPWEELRQALVQPALDPELVEVNADQARFVAQGQAICSFVADNRHGAALVERCIRHWGEADVDPDRGFLGEDLGVLTEWSQSLPGLRPLYTAVALDMEGLKATTSALDETERLALFERLEQDLHTLENGFERIEHEEPRSAVEMFSQLDEWKGELAICRSEHGQGEEKNPLQERIAHLERVLERCRTEAKPLYDDLDEVRGVVATQPRTRLLPKWEDLYELMEVWLKARSELLGINRSLDRREGAPPAARSSRVSVQGTAEFDPNREDFLGICLHFQGGLGKSGDAYRQWERALQADSPDENDLHRERE